MPVEDLSSFTVTNPFDVVTVNQDKRRVKGFSVDVVLQSVSRQRAEVVDLSDLGAAANGVQRGLAKRADVEPTALDAGLTAYLSHGVAGPQKEETPGIATPGGPGSRSPAGDERLIWCHRRR